MLGEFSYASVDAYSRSVPCRAGKHGDSHSPFCECGCGILIVGTGLSQTHEKGSWSHKQFATTPLPTPVALARQTSSEQYDNNLVVQGLVARAGIHTSHAHLAREALQQF